MLTLILGGARSGKSRFAQALCKDVSEVIYVATAHRRDPDEEMQARIVRHRAERPQAWASVEEPIDIARVVRESPTGAMLLVDCITVWLANLGWEFRGANADERERLILEKVVDFARASREREVVAVSNEVGGGIVPMDPVGRAFRDLQGLSNQVLAKEAARVLLLVAGLPLTLKDERR
jgi:adenosylcobinamide kinase/adenosylcobinamide-phosphate guanylyltransferase